MMYIIADFVGGFIIALFIGFVIALLLFPYYSNCGIPKAINEVAKEVEGLTKEVRELRKTIEERSEE